MEGDNRKPKMIPTNNKKTTLDLLQEANENACRQLGYLPIQYNINIMCDWNCFRQLVSNYMLQNLKGRTFPIKTRLPKGSNEWKKLNVPSSPIFFTYPKDLTTDIKKYRFLLDRVTHRDINPNVFIDLVSVLNISNKIKETAMERCFL